MNDPHPLALIAQARMGASVLGDMNTNNPRRALGATRIRVGSIHDLELFLAQVADALEATLPEPLPRRTVTLGATTGTATIIYPKE